MKANELPSTRQSFSADKSKDLNESDSSSTASNELLNKTFKCESASFLSVRSKQVRKNHLDSLLTENLSPKYLKLDRKEDHKTFLKGYQTLEKLNKIITLNTNKSRLHEDASDSEISLSNLREIILYRSVLKKLLEERCTLILKEECDICIKRSSKLIDDFRKVYMNEKIKMMTMPIQSCNRFVSSNDLNIPALQLLIKKLQVICDLQFSIRSSYIKIIDCFHLGLDINLYQQVTKTNSILVNLKSSLFYWAHKCVTIFVQKLSLADSNTVSTDFLQNVLECCQVFNLLLKSHKISNFNCNKSMFNSFLIKSVSKEFSFDIVLNSLAFFEAKATAEKIVHSLTSSCKRCCQVNTKAKRLISMEKKTHSFDSSTSDYYSGTVSNPDVETIAVKALPFLNFNSNFINLLFTVVQRNQNLILKYLYAITSVQGCSGENKLTRRASQGCNTKPQSARQMWCLSEPVHKNDDCVILEENYWSVFWSNTKNFILKVLFEIPYHQYGDSVAGSIFLWPDAFVQTLLECLIQGIESSDIASDGRYTMKQVHDYILMYRAKANWDKGFLLAHSATYSHLCAPVPTSSSQIRTHCGNLLYACIESVVLVFDRLFYDMDLFGQSLHQLRSLLDCYILWTSNKTTSFISSQNLSGYLLITCSDCSLASKLLKEKALPQLSFEQYLPISRTTPFLKCQLVKVIVNQIDAIYGYEMEAPNVIYKVCFSFLTNCIASSIMHRNSWKRYSLQANSTSFDAQETLIFPLGEVVEHLSDHSSLLKVITSAVSQSIEYSLHHLRKNRRTKNLHLLNVELDKFLQWIDSLHLSETEKMELKQMHSIRKLNVILKLIESPAFQFGTCFKQRNRVVPLVPLEHSIDDDILSELEKRHWQKLSRRTFIHLCI